MSTAKRTLELLARRGCLSPDLEGRSCQCAGVLPPIRWCSNCIAQQALDQGLTGDPTLASAYLVAVFNLQNGALVFQGVDIFSEPEPTVGAARRCFVVYSIEDVTYAEASRHLRRVVETAPMLEWVKPHLRKRGV